MTKLQELFIRNLRNERKKARLTQEQAAERIGITHSFFSAIEGGAKFPSVQKIQDIAEALGIPAYRLFVDRPEIEEMPAAELLDLFVEFLVQRYRTGMVAAKTEFLKGLESLKETGRKPFEGDEMFQE
jgi:transcriptional regulator with XRE-family HTH domain